MGNKNKTEEIRGDMAGGKAHIILMMQIESIKRTGTKGSSMAMSKLFMADLAGTEKTLGVKGNHFSNQGKKVKEGGNVNKSLLALSNCITVLSEGRPGNYIPYRDSKLTRLLKDSLGGNSRTVMITTVSISMRDYEETVNSLKYAIRAKAIKNHAVKNISGNVDINVNEMKHIMETLQKENQELKKQLDKDGQPGPNKYKGPSPATDLKQMKGPAGGILNALLSKIKSHFEIEKSLRQAKLANEEKMINLNDDMEQAPHMQTDSNLVKLNQLKNERAKLNDDLLVKSKERARLMDEVNESGLNSLQVTYLSNIMYKEQLDAVQLVN